MLKKFGLSLLDQDLLLLDQDLLLLDQDLLLLGNELRLEQRRQDLQDVTRGHVVVHHPLAHRRIGMPIRDAMVHPHPTPPTHSQPRALRHTTVLSNIMSL